MKLVRNTGTDRVIDLLRPGLTAGRQLDVVTPAFSLFAFSEMLHEVATLVRCRLLLPPASAELAVLGSDADRTARNRLQTRWLARRLSQWLENKTEIRRALGAVPQGAFVLRDGEARPLQVLLGSLAFSTDGLVALHKEQTPAGESTVVFRDSAFADDVAKTNLAAILNQHGLQNVRSL
jgi:hypothetical protein